MKKVLTSLWIVMTLIASQFTMTHAMSYEESYQTAKSYYQKKTVLQSTDEVFAYASLGLDVSSLPVENIVNTGYASDIAKTVIALILHKDDPRNYQGVNYVEMLEECVHDNGAFDKKKDSPEANFQLYGVYALYVIKSDKLAIAADYLASLIDEQGAFGSSWGPSLDVTAWVIEALSLVDTAKYQEVINQALAYIQSTQDETGGYADSYMGVNVNTQACVLMGLLAYDAAGVKGTTYNKGDNNPYDLLLKYQNSNGSFYYSELGEENYYATLQGVQAVGYYNHGSLYKSAQALYQEIISQPVKEEVKEEPVKKEENKPAPQKDKTSEAKPQKTKVVKTSDSSLLGAYLGMLLLSGWVVVKGRKYFG